MVSLGEVDGSLIVSDTAGGLRISLDCTQSRLVINILDLSTWQRQ